MRKSLSEKEMNPDDKVVSFWRITDFGIEFTKLDKNMLKDNVKIVINI